MSFIQYWQKWRWSRMYYMYYMQEFCVCSKESYNLEAHVNNDKHKKNIQICLNTLIYQRVLILPQIIFQRHYETKFKNRRSSYSNWRTTVISYCKASPTIQIYELYIKIKIKLFRYSEKVIRVKTKVKAIVNKVLVPHSIAMVIWDLN